MGVLAVLKDPANLSAVVIYLILYGFSNLGAFAALAELGSDKGEKDVTLLSLEGVAASQTTSSWIPISFPFRYGGNSTYLWFYRKISNL